MLGNKVTMNLLLCMGNQQRTTENLFVESMRKAEEGKAQRGDAQRDTRSWHHKRSEAITVTLTHRQVPVHRISLVPLTILWHRCSITATLGMWRLRFMEV